MKTNTLIAEGKEFVFEFSFSENDPISPNVSPPVDSNEPVSGDGKYVECFIYRREQPVTFKYYNKHFTNDKPDKYFYWKGMLNAVNPVLFQLTYNDNINIKGDMRVFQNVQTDLSYVWVDCDFGLNLIHHFMGDMAQIAE